MVGILTEIDNHRAVSMRVLQNAASYALETCSLLPDYYGDDVGDYYQFGEAYINDDIQVVITFIHNSGDSKENVEFTYDFESLWDEKSTQNTIDNFIAQVKQAAAEREVRSMLSVETSKDQRRALYEKLKSEFGE